MEFFNRPSRDLIKRLEYNNIEVIDRYSDDLYAGDRLDIASQFNGYKPVQTQSNKGASKVFSVLGAGLLSGALVLSVADYPDGLTIDQLDQKIEDRQSAIKTMSVVGGISFTIGILID